MTPNPRQHSTDVVPNVLRQHVEDAAALWVARSVLTGAPHVKPYDLRRSDDRLAAHLDGLSVAGPKGWRFCEVALEVPLPGAVFPAAIHAIKVQQAQGVEHLLTLAQDSPAMLPALRSAFGWVERQSLQGLGAGLLSSRVATHRMIGVAACAMHGIDPGLPLRHLLQDPESTVRARALRTAGQLGLSEHAAACDASKADDDADCRFWAVWSAVLLGDRGRALDTLAQVAAETGPHRERAFRLALQAMTPAAAHAALQRLGGRPHELRWLIQGSGINGDPAYVSWLIRHMAEEKTARVAGEAFALLSGADLDTQQLWQQLPPNSESGPTDNSDDENVALDPDEGLMWPDQRKVQVWWDKNASRFQAGVRYFMGAPVTREHCIDVLKNGYQRQRVLAAHYLCLLEPGTPLFNTSAPAWRQQRWLAKLT